MDSLINFMFRYDNMIALKRFGTGTRYGDFLFLIHSKWPQLMGRRVKLVGFVASIGEFFLDDDDEVGSIIGMLQDSSITRCEIQVKVAGDVINEDVDSSMVGSVSLGSGKLIEYSSCVVDGDRTDFTVGESHDVTKLLSFDWRYLIREEGQVFPGGVEEFRKALVKFSVELGFEYRCLKNEQSRVYAECKLKDETNCRWEIRATLDRVTDFFVIRSYVPEHDCDQGFGKVQTRKFTARVILDLISDDIRNMPCIRPRDVQRQVKKKFGVDISYFLSWKATEVCKSLIFGDYSKSYSYLPAYFAEVERTNPDSVVALDLDLIKKNFRRCFFAFGASLQGFKSCRPVLMIDGTFMKGKHKGILLSAVGKDGNEGKV